MNAAGQITLAGARVAVILEIVPGNPQTLYGTAHPELDDDLGPVVRIDLDGPADEGSPSLIIPQEQWDTDSRTGKPKEDFEFVLQLTG